MADTIQYGRCKNKARCSLAFNNEKVFVPLDGRCPECGVPLEQDSMARRRLNLVPLVLVVALLGAGIYFAKKKFIDPAAPGTRTAARGARGNQADSDLPPSGIGASSMADSNSMPPNASEAPGGAVDRPKFDLEDDANAKARRDVLARIGLMPHLSDAQKSKLTTSVDRARGMGCIFIIPFEAGKKALGSKETEILVNGFKSASIQKLIEDPTLVFVVLGYADTAGDREQNEKASIDRAQSVLNAMRERAGVQNVMYSVGMGGSSLFDKKSAAKNRLVEIWAVYP